MTRRPTFAVLAASAPDRLPRHRAGLAIVCIVALSWFACVGGAWAIAGAIRLLARVQA